MTNNHLTYLQFKATAERLQQGSGDVNEKKLYDVLANISSKEIIDEYYKRWINEKNDKPNQESSREDELEKVLSITRATLESTADAILIIDNTGKITDFNQKFLEITEIPPEIIESGEENDGLGYLLTLLENPEDLVSQVEYLMKHPHEDGDMGDVIFKNGKIVERYSQPHRIGSEIVGRVWSFRDVTNQRKQEASLRLSNRALTASTHGVVIIKNDEKHSISSINPAGLQLLNLTEETAINHNFLTCFECFKDYLEIFHKIFSGTKKGSITINCDNVEKKTTWLEINIDPVRDIKTREITHFVAIINDVTKNKELENLLKFKAVHDTLTGLPNKSYIEDAIVYRIQKAKDKPFGIFFIDIDRFKNINDTLGHRVGDKLLRLFGKRMRHSLNKADIISRIGGDEFIILLNDIDSIAQLNKIAKRLLKNCRKSFTESEHEFNISASIGIAHYPECGNDPEELIRKADIAMYEAKKTGRNKACFYSNQLNQTISRRVEIENELHKAIRNNEFHLVYQPIYDVRTDQFNKAEALIRWKNKKIGQISPFEFISVAEDIGMMGNIGRWVIENAVMQLKTWRENSCTDFKLSVNISPKQLMDENFVQHINHTLEKYGVPAEALVLELTESFFLLEGAILETLSQLNDIGLKLSIDDFGTGYSNLSYLNQLHITYLKIDKVFIDQIEYEDFNHSVLLAILAIAKEMDYIVVAEGVESKNQVDFLKAHDCDQIQGYYFSKPLELDNFNKFIKKNKRK